MTEMPAYVTYEMRGNIAILSLNRIDKRNALSNQVVEEISAAVERARGEAGAGVICGKGGHFCAGLDLAEHRLKTPFEGMRSSRRWHEVFGQIEFGPIPWFSALHGAVIGGGLELAASTHVRVADNTAFFALPEGQRGIFVGGGGSVRAARLMGVARMTDLMLTGRTIDAQQAERWNIVQYVVPAGTALDAAFDLAKQAASNAELSNYSIVNGLPRIAEMSRDDGLFAESFISAFTATSPDAEARMTAFLDKQARRSSPAKEA
ncbi:crotonase/enoyl-CoA hydratase family protein [Bradyrhizobium sp. HKCCYLS20291]|uniref:crotonase/enoyl-CoA hydratase family protein n=1 Tax=Bradyrhizobium sp. HKCCYLS20291 TaxID=3420766 RepID=UPI003EB6ACD3